MHATCDVIVVGAGVVGSAVARELACHELRVGLVEALEDVGAGTSKANTAIWHTGFDATPGTLESKLLRRGYPLLEQFVSEVGIPSERLGGLLVAWNDEQLQELPAIRQKATRNGVDDLRILEPDELQAMEPNLGSGALGGLLIPGESILCPYSVPLALAYEAVLNGAQLYLNSPLTQVRVDDAWTRLQAGPHVLHTRWVINAAGLYSDVVDGWFGHARFKITPRRGELIVFDKAARALVHHVILPVPTRTTKGVLVSPTVFGNVLLGPTAQDLEDKEDRSTTEDGLRSLLEKGQRILPRLVDEEITATYAGLRAATATSDYLIDLDADARYVLVGGIRSTGLSAAMGIAEHVRELLANAGLDLVPRKEPKRVRMPGTGERSLRPHADPAAVKRNPEYGTMVCHCERVSLGEIHDALHAPIPAISLDGLRRRTRCLQGRCQGFHCLAHVTRLLGEATGHSMVHLLGMEDDP